MPVCGYNNLNAEYSTNAILFLAIKKCMSTKINNSTDKRL